MTRWKEGQRGSKGGVEGWNGFMYTKGVHNFLSGWFIVSFDG
jgi:hypothetical protein